MNIETIKLNDIPKAGTKTTKKWGRWVQYLDHLSTDEALKIKCDSMDEAKKVSINIYGCIRKGRRGYTVHTRRVVVDGDVMLYVWKD